MMYYQPPSTTDLLEWKDNPPPSSEKPQAVVDLMESLFQILGHLGRTASSYHAMFNRKGEAHAPAGGLGPAAWARAAAPKQHPAWDFTTDEGQACTC